MNFKILLLILISVLIFYLPILINPNTLLNRNNDLQEQFWPAFYFIKQQFLINPQLPLWNNLWFAGMPLISDPQFSFVYPPNLLFLLLPTDTALIVILFLHILLGSTGVYFTSKRAFGLSKKASFFTSLTFILMPKLAGYLETGHIGLVESLSWIPFIILSTAVLSKSFKFRWVLLLSFSLAGVFFTHTIIFIIVVIASFFFYVSCLTLNKKVHNLFIRIFLYLFPLVTTFGLTAITLLPQIQFTKFTSRFILLSNRDVYPKWVGVDEFLQIVFVPWINGIQNLWQIDSEKWLTFGIVLPFFALIGFLTFSKKIKIIIFGVVTLIIMISLNNISFIHNFLIMQDFYVLMRVSTRVWTLLIFIVIFLAGFGFDIMLKGRGLKITLVLATLSILELTFLSLTYLSKPVKNLELVPNQVYDFLKKDDEKFRVYCTTRCLSQKKSAEYGFELLDGYNTISQINFYKEAWQLTGGYWNYYTLSIPPVGLYKFDKPQPDPISLGAYNVKYIISTYSLSNKNFSEEEKFGEYLIYRNKLYLPRAYFFSEDQKPLAEARILSYTPNQIKINTDNKPSTKLVLSEVYSPGWKAYLNGTKEIQVQEKPDALRLVDLRKDTKFVDFRYDPPGFKLGLLITSTTLLVLFGLIWKASNHI